MKKSEHLSFWGYVGIVMAFIGLMLASAECIDPDIEHPYLVNMTGLVLFAIPSVTAIVKQHRSR